MLNVIFPNSLANYTLIPETLLLGGVKEFKWHFESKSESKVPENIQMRGRRVVIYFEKDFYNANIQTDSCGRIDEYKSYFSEHNWLSIVEKSKSCTIIKLWFLVRNKEVLSDSITIIYN